MFIKSDCQQFDDTKFCCRLIINITLSQDLRNGKTKLVKNSENSRFTILYQNGVWFSRLAVTLVIILKFVTGLPNCPITKPKDHFTVVCLVAWPLNENEIGRASCRERV